MGTTCVINKFARHWLVQFLEVVVVGVAVVFVIISVVVVVVVLVP